MFREIGGFAMSVDTSKLWAIGALSASVCVITSIVAYYTWSHLHGKNTSSLFTNESTKKKRKPKKKKKKKSRASSNSTESINDNGNIAIGHEENSAESSEWIQVRPRRRKSKAKE